MCVIFTGSLTAQTQENPAPLPPDWQRLTDPTESLACNFLFSPGQSLEERHIACPTTVIRPSLSPTRRYLIRLSELNALLEQAGIQDPVTIRLAHPRHNFSLPLGAYKPIINKNNSGSISVDWNIPAYLPVKIPRQVIRHIITKKVKENEDLRSSEFGALIFENPAKNLWAQVRCRYSFPFRYAKKAFIKLDALLIGGKHEKALKYCRRSEANLRFPCFSIAAEAMFSDQFQQWLKAKDPDVLDRFCKNQIEELRPYAYRTAGEACFENGMFEKAALYYIKSGLEEVNPRTGDAYFQLGQLEKALQYYEQGMPTINRAHAYAKLAELSQKKGQNQQAKSLYKKAVNAFETMIKNNYYQWQDKDNALRLKCRMQLHKLGKSAAEKAQDQKLNRILKKAAHYCKRLDHAVIRFFCKEDIKEHSKYQGNTNRQTLLYEYQLIHENDKFTERRILLRKNGRKTRQEDVPLETVTYQYEKLIFGPIGFLAKGWQNHFDYKILGEEDYNGEKAIVLEVLPLRWSNINLRGGKIWLKASNMAVLKIQFMPKYLVTNFVRALENATWNNAELHIDFICEFNVERSGIRFPSKYLIEESHISPNGERKIKSKIDVTFKDFMFFAVASEVVESGAEY
jgi:tetratricopeptide (TPR) repeat protein